MDKPPPRKPTFKPKRVALPPTDSGNSAAPRPAGPRSGPKTGYQGGQSGSESGGYQGNSNGGSSGGYQGGSRGGYQGGSSSSPGGSSSGGYQGGARNGPQGGSQGGYQGHSSGGGNYGPRKPGGFSSPSAYPTRGGPRGQRPWTRDEADHPRRQSPPPGELGYGVKIVFQDADLMVINKPPGLLTAGTPGEERLAVYDLIKRYCQEAAPRPTSRSRQRDLAAAGHDFGPRVGAGIIHRLDKEASGLLVFSKSDRAYQGLKEDFKLKRVHRHYIAVLEGELGKAGDQGTIQSLLKESKDGKVHSIPADSFRGHIVKGEEDDMSLARPATTHYRVLAIGGGVTLAQVRLETGRKHQIRAHMSEKGHPLVGDHRYGAKSDPLGRLALHAAELGFTHPGTGMKERYTAPAPRSFYALAGAEALAHKVEEPVAPAPNSIRPLAGTTPRPGLSAAPTAWEAVAEWYDDLLEDRGSDHYQRVIVPGVVRLLAPKPGDRILDVACGQGLISRALTAAGASVVGVDAASSLIEAATKRGGGEFHVGDARNLATLNLPEASFDTACCIMALTNIDPLEPVLTGVASLLKTGGRLLWVIVHPAFRSPDQTGWGWDEKAKAQFRRVDGYLSPMHKAIQMHPGSAPDITTTTFHRPLQTYVRAMSDAGFTLSTLEEWPAVRISQPGPRAEAENRARREIPLFLAVEATKR